MTKSLDDLPKVGKHNYFSHSIVREVFHEQMRNALKIKSKNPIQES